MDDAGIGAVCCGIREVSVGAGQQVRTDASSLTAVNADFMNNDLNSVMHGAIITNSCTLPGDSGGPHYRPDNVGLGMTFGGSWTVDLNGNPVCFSSGNPNRRAIYFPLARAQTLLGVTVRTS